MSSAFKNVTAAILAGGLGSRLRSVVADRPKVLAPLGNRPFLTRLFDQLGRFDLSEVVLLAGFGADQLRSALGARYRQLSLTYSIEPAPLGTAGAVRRALPLCAGRTILLLNGDSYCDLDLSAFYRFHLEHEGISIALTRVDDASRYGSVRLGPGNRIVAFAEKEASGEPGWINAGIYLIERGLLEAIVAGKPSSLERDFVPAQVELGHVHGFRCDGKFIDIGTPDSYAAAEKFFLD